MSNYFGTDGIRGIAGEDLTARTAFALGNALCRQQKGVSVVVGRDNRVSSNMLFLGLASGITAGGGNVIDGGILPTPAVSYFVKRYNADYGVVISASHNPAQYNGLKVFNSYGNKLAREEELKLEKVFDDTLHSHTLECGNFKQLSYRQRMQYLKFLEKCTTMQLHGKKIVVDCANGVASFFAPQIFKKLGAEVIAIHTEKCGYSINENCGALYPQDMQKTVLDTHADIGFCYDGDADRLIACDENGQLLDGDKLLYMFALRYQQEGKLGNHLVIGTAHTNTAIVLQLAKKNITVLRADIGDKYVAEMMRKYHAVLGGEQSGHLILADYISTGDGILASVKIAELLQNGPISKQANIELMPQYNLTVKVRDKVRILGRESVQLAIENANKQVERIVVRASGTEDVIRIFSEAIEWQVAKKTAENVRDTIIMEDKECAEL